MLVETESGSDSEPLHYNERGAICEGIRFVRVLSEVLPCLMEQSFIDMDPLHRGASQ